mmetsp:Transcript_734/g.1840  ORF Transcript_734/g.1840 Transcript_734/m.1840 type:complete len:326 (+) Transcript_734:109-1086(+)
MRRECALICGLKVQPCRSLAALARRFSSCSAASLSCRIIAHWWRSCLRRLPAMASECALSLGLQVHSASSASSGSTFCVTIAALLRSSWAFLSSNDRQPLPSNSRRDASVILKSCLSGGPHSGKSPGRLASPVFRPVRALLGSPPLFCCAIMSFSHFADSWAKSSTVPASASFCALRVAFLLVFLADLALWLPTAAFAEPLDGCSWPAAASSAPKGPEPAVFGEPCSVTSDSPPVAEATGPAMPNMAAIWSSGSPPMLRLAFPSSAPPALSRDGPLPALSIGVASTVLRSGACFLAGSGLSSFCAAKGENMARRGVLIPPPSSGL